jgi:hypothetical protein
MTADHEPETTLYSLWNEMYRAIRANRDATLMIELRARIEAEVRAEAGIDVERLARALCRYRWPNDPGRYDETPEFWLREAAGYAAEYWTDEQPPR